MPTILDGKTLATEIKEDVAEKVKKLDRQPCLAVVLVGDNSASQVYVRSKKRDCEECGILCRDYVLPESVSQFELLELISQLNTRYDVDGILVQLPLPRGLDKWTVLQSIAFNKDVDGFTVVSMGWLALGAQVYTPCTAEGVLRLLQENHIQIKGKHCVIAGRSDIVGKPLAQLMLQEDATVTVCHSQTPETLLADLIDKADIFVSAVGDPHYLTDLLDLRTGFECPPILVDVGINRGPNGKLCGDIPAYWYKYCEAYTPVPGGVGPMTRAILMENVLRAAKRRQR